MSHLEELRQDRRVTDDDVLRARIAVLDNHIRLLSQKRRVEVHDGLAKASRTPSQLAAGADGDDADGDVQAQAQMSADQADFERAAKEMIRRG